MRSQRVFLLVKPLIDQKILLIFQLVCWKCSSKINEMNSASEGLFVNRKSNKDFIKGGH